jgi:hypothetical protein
METAMTIRAIGPLLCGGLLVLATTTGAYAQKTTLPLASAKTTVVTPKVTTLPTPNGKGNSAAPKTQGSSIANSATKKGETGSGNISDQAAGGILTSY